MAGGEAAVEESTQAILNAAKSDENAALEGSLDDAVNTAQENVADVGEAGDANIDAQTQQPAGGNAPGEGGPTGGGGGEGGGGNDPETPTKEEIDTKSAEELAEDTSQKGMEDALEEVEKKIY